MSEREFDFPLSTLIRQAGRLQNTLARRSAGLAFKGNQVVLRQEFQVRVHEPQGLVTKSYAPASSSPAANKYATEPAGEGWAADDATCFKTPSVLGQRGPATGSQ